jgi:hypothetical protein
MFSLMVWTIGRSLPSQSPRTNRIVATTGTRNALLQHEHFSIRIEVVTQITPLNRDRRMRRLVAFFRTLTLRALYCSQGEHKRETVEPFHGMLRQRCLDCSHETILGVVHPYATNRKARI